MGGLSCDPHAHVNRCGIRLWQGPCDRFLAAEMTRKKLGWKPKYASFASFMEAGAEDVYSAEAEGLGALGMKHK